MENDSIELLFRLHFEMNGSSKTILDDEQMDEILKWFKPICEGYRKTKLSEKKIERAKMWFRIIKNKADFKGLDLFYEDCEKALKELSV